MQAAAARRTVPNGAQLPGAPQFPTCKVDRRLSDGEQLHLGNKVLYVPYARAHAWFGMFFAALFGEAGEVHVA
jgi:hypothetical protein